MENVYDNELYSCIRIGFDEFKEIMDELTGMEDSVDWYWFISSSGSFNIKTTNIPEGMEFDVSDIAAYFGINRIYDLHYYSGCMYILFRE